MRIFIALDINDAIRLRIARFIDGVRGFAPDARWVKPESLHVTLKFIGEKPATAVEEIKRALSSIRAKPIEMSLRSYGFFPTVNAARVLWIGIESGPELRQLAAAVDEAVKAVGIPAEDRPFSPHLTLARRAGGSGTPRWRKGDSPNRDFRLLQEKLAALPSPEFGTMTAHGFFLYESQLRREGARYTKIARFALGNALS